MKYIVLTPVLPKRSRSPCQSKSQSRKMNFSQVVFLVFLVSFITFTKSFKLSKVYDALIGKKSNGKSIDDLRSNNSNYTGELSSFDDSEPSSPDSVDCSDLTSTFGRAMKWWLVATSNRKNTLRVRFFLSSRKQRGQVEVLVGDQFGLDWADFKIERRTVFIVHGYKSNGFKSWVKQMEEAFFLWGDVNLVVVDWSEGQKSANYYDAAVDTKMVGNEIARFLNQVVNVTSSTKPNWGVLHLVGHSLGAHICGVAAREFKEMQNNWQVSRITGLDPAYPCFNGTNSEFRLDRTDAPFVDVIHTSSSAKTTLGFGTPDAIGDIDFYPNGGKKQPGCSQRKGSLLASLNVPKSPIEQGKCSHRRAYLYLTESLIGAASGNCTFWGHPWDRSTPVDSSIMSEHCDVNSCTEMGIRAENHLQRGTFYVKIPTTPPFCTPFTV